MPTLWVQLSGSLHSFARRRLANSYDAEDAVAETFARALVSVSRRPAHVPTGAWLGGILRNVIREWERRPSSEPLPDGGPALADSTADPLAELTRRELAAEVSAAFSQLQAQERRVLQLRVLEHRRAAEVAEIMGSRPAAVRMAQTRAMRQLRRHVDVRACRS